MEEKDKLSVAKPTYKLAELISEMPDGLPRVAGWDEMTPVGRELSPERAEKSITLAVELSDEEVAYQLAQFAKRASLSTFYELTEAHLTVDERTRLAYQMLAGIGAVQHALAEAGYAPR